MYGICVVVFLCLGLSVRFCLSLISRGTSGGVSLPPSCSSKPGSREQEAPELGLAAQVPVPMSARDACVDPDASMKGEMDLSKQDSNRNHAYCFLP